MKGVFIIVNEIKCNGLFVEYSYYNVNDIRFEKVDYDQAKVNYFFAKKALMEKSKVFLKRTSGKCNWCPFKRLCASNGSDRSELKESSLQKLDAEL